MESLEKVGEGQGEVPVPSLHRFGYPSVRCSSAELTSVSPNNDKVHSLVGDVKDFVPHV